MSGLKYAFGTANGCSMGKWLSKGVTAGETNGVKDICAWLATSDRLLGGTGSTNILLFFQPSVVVEHVLVLLRCVLRLSVILLLLVASLYF